MTAKYLLALLYTFILIFNASLPTTGQAHKTDLLFDSDVPLSMTLVADVKKIKKDESSDPKYSDATLILQNDIQGDKTFTIQVKARGNARRLFDFCSFPPIKINFKKKEVRNTVFEGQDKLKLVTYCKDMDLNETYILQEYLLYKVYNLLTPLSFKVRLAKVTYRDTNGKGHDVTRFGFLIEDDDILAKRNGGKISDILLSNHDRCERSSLDIFTIFQYMIGNTDWWMARPKIHNVKLVAMPNGNIKPVPYDFDYCGVVNANYATPAEKLPISSVRERYFRGYCRLPGTYEKTVEIFNTNKNEIYALYSDFPYLDDRQKKITLKYYDDFYEIVNDPKKIKRNIYDKCELNHHHLHASKQK